MQLYSYGLWVGKALAERNNNLPKARQSLKCRDQSFFSPPFFSAIGFGHLLSYKQLSGPWTQNVVSITKLTSRITIFNLI